jgi:hypothetical protein
MYYSQVDSNVYTHKLNPHNSIFLGEEGWKSRVTQTLSECVLSVNDFTAANLIRLVNGLQYVNIHSTLAKFILLYNIYRCEHCYASLKLNSDCIYIHKLGIVLFIKMFPIY